VAAASDLPVILYNIPTRTGIDMPDRLCAELAQAHTTIRAIKQARPGTPAPIDGLDVYAGDDDRFADALDAGAVGGILVASHLVGGQMARMVHEPSNRAEIHASLQGLFAALSVTVNPIPIKAALGLVGLPAGPLRPPLVEADEGELEAIAAALRELGLAPVD